MNRAAKFGSILLSILISTLSQAIGDEFDHETPTNNWIDKNIEDESHNAHENQHQLDIEHTAETNVYNEEEDFSVYSDHPADGVEMDTMTWNINKYMKGCDHDVADCLDAAKKQLAAKGKEYTDDLLFDCIEEKNCTPMKYWACDSNLNFANSIESLTERCLKWGLYHRQEEPDQTEKVKVVVEKEL